MNILLVMHWLYLPKGRKDDNLERTSCGGSMKRTDWRKRLVLFVLQTLIYPWVQGRREDPFSALPLRGSPVSLGSPVSPGLTVPLASSESPESSGSCRNIAPYAAIALRENITVPRPVMAAKASFGDPSGRITNIPVGKSHPNLFSFLSFFFFFFFGYVCVF